MIEDVIKWPPLPSQHVAPVWTGTDFVIGNERAPVLCYQAADSGWNNDLTRMHEEVAGAHHYIDRASRRNAIRALAPVLSRRRPVILEVGCSSGFLLQDLRRTARHALLVGSDFIRGPLFNLVNALPGVPLVQLDITQCPLPDASFDGIVLLNVLEHIADDAKALAEIYRLLKPGGFAFIEVPAGPHLFDYYDAHLMHYRRYTLAGLKRLAERAGFTVRRASHLGFFLYPLFAMVKKMNRRKGEAMSATERQALVTRHIRKGNTNALLHGLMRMELALGKYARYPVGIRCVMTLQKG